MQLLDCGIVFLSLFFFRTINAYVHPIEVQGRYFIDTVTKEPFYIKGVDYQPGGSSGITDDGDPLSNPETCARDIVLFQELGINTIRIYSINADLNHDICMSMLAAAGIYLVLDVNSPLPNHHLNRYEPWTTYNTGYLKNVFKTVEQFSYYNNTLGFFAGNEIVNDKSSAKHSPVYIKAMIRDIKTYIEFNSPRIIPVGYSAADDLNYRTSLSSYLGCVDDNPEESADFYGVNSYQWCGRQTFHTSGYDTLVEDYSNYTRPVFFSEYGCNEVLPRLFEEVQALYSSEMTGVFSGGLVYEFTQEPNNYGLVKVQSNGNITLLPDFLALKEQFDALEEFEPEVEQRKSPFETKAKNDQSRLKFQKFGLPQCEKSYENLDTSKGLPKSLAKGLINKGILVERGKYVDLSEEQLETKFRVFSPKGDPYDINLSIETVVDIMSGTEMKRTRKPRVPHKSLGNHLSANLVNLLYLLICGTAAIVI